MSINYDYIKLKNSDHSYRDLEICYFSAAIFFTSDRLRVSWLTNNILQRNVFSSENIWYFPEIHLKHVGKITNYNRIYIFSLPLILCRVF